MTAQIIYPAKFHTANQNNDIGSKYFRVTSASKKPCTVSAREKLNYITARGWIEFKGYDFVCYFNPRNNEPYYLDDAYDHEVMQVGARI